MTTPTISHRSLVCVTGMSPQVVTETLYALIHDTQAPFIPNEIHIISTARGKRFAESVLLGENGYISQMIKDFKLPTALLSNLYITAVSDAQGEPLDDLKTPEDNAAFANLLTQTLSELTENPNSAVHVSIAGGRKTMGYYAGYALSLFGRPQDTLSHVLVAEEFESLPEFYYPTPYNKTIRNRQGQPILNAADATVSLAYIPFVAMRQWLSGPFKDNSYSFSQIVDVANMVHNPPPLIINLTEHCITLGEHTIKPNLAHFALYAWAAWRSAKGESIQFEGQKPSQAFADQYLQFYKCHFGDTAAFAKLCASMNYEEDISPIQGKSEAGLEYEKIQEMITRIKNAIKEQLSQEHATLYNLRRESAKNEDKKYQLPAQQHPIQFIGLNSHYKE